MPGDAGCSDLRELEAALPDFRGGLACVPPL